MTESSAERQMDDAKEDGNHDWAPRREANVFEGKRNASKEYDRNGSDSPDKEVLNVFTCRVAGHFCSTALQPNTQHTQTCYSIIGRV